MNELKQKIAEVLKPYQLYNLATIDKNGEPWVRYIYAKADDDLTIRFATCIKARKIEHFKKSSSVHLTCGIGGLEDIQKPFLQITGKVEIDQSNKEKHEFWNPLIENIYNGPNDPDYAVIKIKPETIEYWKITAGEPQVLIV